MPRKQRTKNIPTFDECMIPIVTALKQLGGSATNQELYEQVVDGMPLSDEQLAVIHDEDKGNVTEVAYRIAWAKTYLKKTGFIENSSRAVWALTKAGQKDGAVDPLKVVQEVRNKYQAERKPSTSITGKKNSGSSTPDLPETDTEDQWRSDLIQSVREMKPEAFERLSQRILRESGFIEVNVTGRSGDGGIDGIGILRVQDLVSFQVLFQCKRYKGSVSPSEIRDFRGAMVGRTDKGLFITTGTFTREAQKEATRDGAPPIDLVDGEQLVDLLKKLNLGVKTEIVEKVTVEKDWFESF